MGIGGYQVINDIDPNSHHYEIVVDAANNYHKQHPERHFDQVFENGLIKASLFPQSYYSFSNLCNSIIYQLDLEKSGLASIDIDDHIALENLRNVRRNLKNLNETKKIDDENYNNLINYIDKADDYLQEHHGKSIK